MAEVEAHPARLEIPLRRHAILRGLFGADREGRVTCDNAERKKRARAQNSERKRRYDQRRLTGDRPFRGDLAGGAIGNYEAAGLVTEEDIIDQDALGQRLKLLMEDLAELGPATLKRLFCRRRPWSNE